ncbi:LuxR family transcriptional regulator [Lentzea nigeriaca]|uniref:LuxR family transcriptional regulator n=1 Tax=Lentzea nigeriaca TaxID=1128665 RepID=UPI00195C2A0D|nr:LuxR family transcriptional regulator [Lentzea nigeriaca]MBM7862668.1 DNA-binding CsgD family transcriptional regulator [Lentzea nigeriaca]
MAAKPGLVGRDRETTQLANALTAAADGDGHLVVATGGLGAGKTALLTTARDLAAQKGFTVLAARGSYLERELPFGLVSRLFVCVRPGEEVQHLPRIAAALGQSDSLAEPGPVTLPELHFLHRALARMAAERPVAIVVDDAQWADQPSLQWLSTLPHRIEHLPVFALAGIGTGEGCTGPQTLEELLAASTSEIRLDELSFDGVRALVEQELGERVNNEFIALCRAEAGGNPLLLLHLVRAYAGHVEGLTAPALLPTVNVRLRRLAPHAPDALHALAVLGGEVTLARVAELIGTEPCELAGTIASLHRMGLLSADGALVHPLVRNTLRDELTITERQDLHAAAARLLTETGASAEAVAEHLVETRPLGEEWATGVLVAAAGRARARNRVVDAVRYLRRAMDEPESDELLAQLGEVESYVDVPAAVDHLGEADPAHPALQGLLALLGEEPEFEPDLIGDPDVVPATPAEFDPYLRALAFLRQRGELAAAYARADRALTIARRWQHRPCIAAALTARSGCLRDLGRLAGAESDASEALAVLESCGAARTSTAIFAALTELSLALLDMGEVDVAAQVFDVVPAEVPDLFGAPALLAARGRVRIAAERRKDGVRDLLDCGERLRARGRDTTSWRLPLGGDHLVAEELLARSTGAVLPLAAVLREQGVLRGVEGIALLEESVELLAPTGAVLERARSHFALGRALHLAGRVKPARAELRVAVDLADDCGVEDLADQIRQELAAGPAGLTESERRVAALAAQGKMNREIAAALFVQLRTVEIHLTKVYRKLGIDGRDQLAPALRLAS